MSEIWDAPTSQSIRLRSRVESASRIARIEKRDVRSERV